MLTKEIHNQIYKTLLILIAISLPLQQRLNVIFIALLFINWILEGEFKSKYRELKTDTFFLLSSLCFLWGAFELFYSDIFSQGLYNFEKKTSIILIPLIILSKKELFNSLKRYFFIYLSYAVSVAIIICVILAYFQYMKDGNIEDFIFHSLAGNINISAIYLSLLCLISAGYIQLNIHEPLFKSEKLKYIILFVLSAGILLLASKMHIVLYCLLSIAILFKNMKTQKPVLIALVLSFLLGIIAIVFTDNPIKTRFNDIKVERVNLLKQDRFTPDIYLDGLSLRLLWIRFGFEILNEHKAWIKGVSPGNTKDLLDNKLKKYNFYDGITNTAETGYLRFNYHNQYIETLVDSGIIGLLLLLLILIYVIYYSHINKDWQLLYGVIIFGICFLSESILERQIGVISFSLYFALLLAPKSEETKLQYS